MNFGRIYRCCRKASSGQMDVAWMVSAHSQTKKKKKKKNKKKKKKKKANQKSIGFTSVSSASRWNVW